MKKTFGISILLVLVCVFTGIREPNFLRASNVENVLNWTALFGILSIGAAFVIGVLTANWVIAKTGVQDPSVVVWDEFIGQWIALLLAPAGWMWMALGFGLFRLFDIWKPWPVSWADRKLHGGVGAMLDDVLAGVYAFATVQLIVALLDASGMLKSA